MALRAQLGGHPVSPIAAQSPSERAELGKVSPKASPFSIHLFSKIRKISILKQEKEQLMMF